MLELVDPLTIVMERGLQVFKQIRAILFVITPLISLWACAENPHKSETVLTVNIGAPVHYESPKGDLFVARYCSVSDGSLNFVKLKTPDGQEYTLPQVLSGSGVRYTDEREIVWWTHHGTVRVDVRGPHGKWITKYSELKETKGGNP